MNLQLTFDTENLLKILCVRQPYTYNPTRNGFSVRRIVKKYKGRKTEFGLHKRITIRPLTAGLIVGEGHLGGKTFVFCNSDENAIKHVFSFMQQFKIKPTLQLEVCTKNTDSNFVAASKGKWEALLKTKINDIRIRAEFNSLYNKIIQERPISQ